MSSTTLPAAPPDAAPVPRATRVITPARLLPWLMLAPSLAVLVVITGYPLVRMLWLSVHEYERAQLLGVPAPFVGLDNYVATLTDERFWAVTARSFVFMLVCVAVTITAGTLVALLLMRLGPVMRLVLSIGMLLAWAMPPLAAMLVWGWIFDTQYGVVNHVLTSLTGDDWMGHSWLISPLSFFAVAALVIVWGAIPFVAFTLYAGFTQIPGEVLEAAQLDGASARQRFASVQVPYVRTIYVVVIVLSMIWDLKVFTQIFVLQGIGGVKARTSTLGVYIYEMGMAQGHYGAASAIAVIFTIIMLAISAYYVRATIREEQL
ncbi:carbohydrate ABC transporter permease [Cellulomonas dongxiuzhuiae]|uniref:Sugar ABC transporter permease n=1 Tax=Cellulomonas dongxiuzhuiae TaxID=2819979 RepID=A0ABX8GNQ7_9CELL|nr:sugar ABC transporter permease [Cellulomonas dongxiuzhuiae]MBO3087717.1 sugar ABC transporter permease [Cellulomonas dongxiuzhuiae]MBO3095923.1 sugar ABC transporter permease [Cellulomonas dongxiuzhuiae]QWC17216.1 sugar ABC transporter permease [Cellulomonas dongxiuzhuiae]